MEFVSLDIHVDAACKLIIDPAGPDEKIYTVVS